MRKRAQYIVGVFCLVLLIVLLVWQGSFTFGAFGPANPLQTLLFWAISTLIFLLTITLGFMLFRTGFKLYLERQTNRAGSRIRTKLVFGAIALSFIPVFFLVLFGYGVMNRNLKIWFTRPAEGIKIELTDTGEAIKTEFESKVQAQARWAASLPEVRAVVEGTAPNTAFFTGFCKENNIARMAISTVASGVTVLCEPAAADQKGAFTARAPVGAPSAPDAAVLLTSRMPFDVAAKQAQIDGYVREYDQLSAHRRDMQNLYLLYMTLITLFVLFVSTWIARVLAEQISGPISALLEAAAEMRRGNLAHRVNVKAGDELATLVRGFNETVQVLEANRDELERRRRFTEAILESIPTGVLSISADGRIQRINRALRGIFDAEEIGRATTIQDLFPRDDVTEFEYLMKRARRTGVAATQLELRRSDRVVHLAATVSAIDGRNNAGFVIILEDTSELLRAQKAMAWQEVARRIAHELKNPLTPIALSAERIARHISRGTNAVDAQRIIADCSKTIVREVESVKQLVDEFSEFARFPAAQPVPADLNQVVRAAMDVFGGRLRDIDVTVELAPGLPAVWVDPEQIKRVVVNLVDNAAEAMQDSALKALLVATTMPAPETIELIVADTGCGISPEDKEKLFLPYFSTKGRGTGLGLAIVNRILSEHNAPIRVEENKPAGARFTIEFSAMTGSAEAEATITEVRA